MLSGFNTNIRHRAVLFHVQTEDSGRAHPHIISHLYYGGTILASEKNGYGELLEGAHGDEKIEDGVKKRMQEQHKEMLRNLRRGSFDEEIVVRLGDSIFPEGTDGDLAFAETGEIAPAPDDNLVDDRLTEDDFEIAIEEVQEVAPAPPASIKGKKRVSAGARALASLGRKKKPAAKPKKSKEHGFGDSIVSDKPLDEVVFDFLVEKARKKPSSK
ncbi:MAG: hypothetical protein JRC77_04355 [Deltaproteobacteria bacterium]|nr:hypothetical protein [Deltaproteobacteria bacterium]